MAQTKNHFDYDQNGMNVTVDQYDDSPTQVTLTFTTYEPERTIEYLEELMGRCATVNHRTGNVFTIKTHCAVRTVRRGRIPI